jgi:hypothetical protein
MSAQPSRGQLLVGHEVVSLASFLDYRARRLRAPVGFAAEATPDAMTAPTVPDPPGRVAVPCVEPPDNR